MTMAAPVPSVRFAYQARDKQGQVVNGIVSAGSLADATKQLRAEGKYIVDIKPARPGAQANSANAAGTETSLESVSEKTKVNRDELINFALQLSVMVDTGVPLSESLHALSEQPFSDTFVAVLKSIDQEV